ncbi:MAG: VTT domain-containing protein [Romboutsia sp.]
MEYIDTFFSMAQDNQGLVFLIAIAATFIESFVPALPLMAIVMANGLMLGFIGGIISSCIGSGLGTIALFLLSRKFGTLKYFDKFRNKKTYRLIDWVKSQKSFVLTLCYSCPFVPGCLVSITSGFCNKELKTFVPGMILGKFILFTVSSYVGDDITGFLKSPEKIIALCLLVVVSFLIGKKLNYNIDKYDISNEVI